MFPCALAFAAFEAWTALLLVWGTIMSGLTQSVREAQSAASRRYSPPRLVKGPALTAITAVVSAVKLG
jgi:hypothetical protein